MKTSLADAAAQAAPIVQLAGDASPGQALATEEAMLAKARAFAEPLLAGIHAGDVERLPGVFLDQPQGLSFAQGLGQPQEVDPRQRPRAGRIDHLDRHAVFLQEAGAQGVVAAEHLLEAALQDPAVERPADAGGEDHEAIDDAAFEALEDSGVILSWHITVFVGKPGDRAVGKAASVFENTKFFLANFLEPFVDLFAWGILERLEGYPWALSG